MTETKQQVFQQLLSDWLGLNLMAGNSVNGFGYWRERYANASDGDPTCQFCHSNPFSAEWKNDEWGIEAYVLGKKMCVYVRGQMDSFPIAYCPQCGRELGDHA